MALSKASLACSGWFNCAFIICDETVTEMPTHCADCGRFVMSPEMVTVARAVHKQLTTYDRRKRSGAGRISDIWSLGCLLYELVVGDFLFFFGGNYAEFFAHLAGEQPVVHPAAREALAAVVPPEQHEDVVGLLEFILVRDPARRPSIAAVKRQCEQVEESIA